MFCLVGARSMCAHFHATSSFGRVFFFLSLFSVYCCIYACHDNSFIFILNQSLCEAIASVYRVKRVMSALPCMPCHLCIESRIA